ncbi:hypothetical protein [Antarcticirhabdus aurantiaca]|uniref:Uncharacterized protein n=1 Tax=Antarcticirhabdus aurantiaca TaxID=2606717 RepID=A0ACD4NMT8_9HYPH|nr:hypothetical protein [Antarcticirhabdus aurantiaca]WAJ28166.1 hypothetical protein OXU80_25640 [Jeongeuplla avenae]
MREIGRLLLLGFAAFLCISFAIYLSNPNIISSLRRQWTELSFTPPTATTSDIFIQRFNRNGWSGLAGFPDRTEIRFPLPPNVPARSGTLYLDLRTQLSQVGDGRLSISINDRTVEEFVLDRGRHDRHFVLTLDQADLQRPFVRVGLRSVGSTGGGQICPVGAVNAASSVEVLPSSGLALDLAEPVRDPAARLALLSEPFAIAYPADPQGQAIAAWTSAYLERLGLGSQFVTDSALAQLALLPEGAAALSDVDAAIGLGAPSGQQYLGALRTPRPRLLEDAPWPVAIERFTNDTLAVTFRGGRRWSIPYYLADMPGGAAPSAITFSIRTGGFAEADALIARVTLNGNLLTSARLSNAPNDQQLRVDLPAQYQGLSNVLELAIVDVSPKPDICAERPEFEAQLLPESSFERGIDEEAAKLALVRILGSAGGISLQQPDAAAGPSSTEAFGDLLAHVMPLRIPPSFQSPQRIAIELVSGSALSTRVAEHRDAPQTMVVLFDAEDRVDGIAVHRIGEVAQDALVTPAAARGALLVSY